MNRLNAQQLRTTEEDALLEQTQHLKRHPIYFILENVYDTYNVGGIFRLADAIGVEKMYLCGQTETPPNHKIKKASIGTYKIVPWEYKASAREAIEELRSLSSDNVMLNSFQHLRSNKKGQTKHEILNQVQDDNKMRIIAVEQSEKSIPYTEANYTLPAALIFGNETSGVLPETLNLVDQIVEIPMWGINKSLNVIVSAAIVSYLMMGKSVTPRVSQKKI